jgi:putative nucleotide binding protein
MLKKDIKKDEWAIVLDFLPHGYYGMRISQPVAQVIGEDYFSLLEVIVRDGVFLKVGSRVYIGEGKRDEIKFIKRRIDFKDLTAAAKQELADIVEKIVKEKPQKFLEFFNKAGPITTRLHQLELLPGIGKKHLWEIISARKEKPFESFEDIKKRISTLPDPEKMVIKRILEEIEDKDKYRIFVPRFEKTQEQKSHGKAI